MRRWPRRPPRRRRRRRRGRDPGLRRLVGSPPRPGGRHHAGADGGGRAGGHAPQVRRPSRHHQQPGAGAHPRPGSHPRGGGAAGQPPDRGGAGGPARAGGATEPVTLRHLGGDRGLRGRPRRVPGPADGPGAAQRPVLSRRRLAARARPGHRWPGRDLPLHSRLPAPQPLRAAGDRPVQGGPDAAQRPGRGGGEHLGRRAAGARGEGRPDAPRRPWAHAAGRAGCAGQRHGHRAGRGASGGLGPDPAPRGGLAPDRRRPRLRAGVPARLRRQPGPPRRGGRHRDGLLHPHRRGERERQGRDRLPDGADAPRRERART